jgi:hypothetical protein
MGSAISAFETAIKIGVADWDGSRLTVRFEPNGANDVSSPNLQGFE